MFEKLQFGKQNNKRNATIRNGKLTIRMKINIYPTLNKTTFLELNKNKQETCYTFYKLQV